MNRVAGQKVLVGRFCLHRGPHAREASALLVELEVAGRDPAGVEVQLLDIPAVEPLRCGAVGLDADHLHPPGAKDGYAVGLLLLPR